MKHYIEINITYSFCSWFPLAIQKAVAAWVAKKEESVKNGEGEDQEEPEEENIYKVQDADVRNV